MAAAALTCHAGVCDARGVRRASGFSAGAVVVMATLTFAASPAQGSHALTPERYAAIDAVYTALVAVKGGRVSGPALTAARRACNGLRRGDALLGPLRGHCFASVSVLRELRRFGRRCMSSPTACLRGTVRLRKAFTRALIHARRANRAIDAVVADRACREAMRTPAKELRSTRRFAAALRALERAAKTESRADFRRVGKLLQGIGYSGLTPEQERDRFRSACA